MVIAPSNRLKLIGIVVAATKYVGLNVKVAGRGLLTKVT